MFVSVIVATRNRRSSVIRCVEALRRQNYPANRYEIIICCDGCDDGTEAALQPYVGKGVTVFSIIHAGKVVAVNAAIQRARGDLGVFLDDDMEASEGLIESHVRAQRQAGGKTVAISGYSQPILPLNSPPMVCRLAKDYERYYDQLGRQGSPDDLSGGNCSIPLRPLRELGCFNETYVFQRDDTELALRWMERGFRLGFAADARTLMYLELTPNVLIGRAENRGKNDYRLGFEHPWYIPALAFYRVLNEPRVRRRWRVLWAVAPVAVSCFRAARLLSPNNERLQNWEYAARYCLGLRLQAGSWEAFLDLRSTHLAITNVV